jgi:hypothetical protein
MKIVFASALCALILQLGQSYTLRGLSTDSVDVRDSQWDGPSVPRYIDLGEETLEEMREALKKFESYNMYNILADLDDEGRDVGSGSGPGGSGSDSGGSGSSPGGSDTDDDLPISDEEWRRQERDYFNSLSLLEKCLYLAPSKEKVVDFFRWLYRAIHQWI